MGSCNCYKNDMKSASVVMLGDSCYRNPPNPHKERIDAAQNFVLFRLNVENLPMNSEVTTQLYATEGPYIYTEEILEDGTLRELRTESTNEGEYYGYWNVSTGEHDGPGAMVRTDGSRYDGMWRHSKANGQGRKLHPSGDVYEGSWVDGKVHGLGAVSYTHLTLPTTPYV
eukprot:TRINITY_DN8235_c0_g1_i3.p1 TRINITY_DN8235_c0_g1~~TRINITY_DN8235_c0_g1_i3.p1  ORF type:complete len:170 (-),score=26.64 TRINITY_DN8235_c0_g1_i3:18-527(-)